MNIWIAILLSSVGASLLGSFVLWVLFSVWPGSNVGFSAVVFLSFLGVSSMVVPPSVLVISFFAKSRVLRIRDYTIGHAVFRTAIVGAVFYFAFYMLLMASRHTELVKQLFVTGTFLFPIFVGALYGACFGLILTRLR